MAKALDSKLFGQVLRKHIHHATRVNGKLLEAAIRKGIQKGVPPPNAKLTTQLKGSTKTLVDDGDLFKAITSTTTHWNRGFVGVMKTDASYDIAQAVHDGVEIPVTEPMRRLFYALWLVSVGSKDGNSLTGRAAEMWEAMPGGWKRLSPSTTAITIPPRPFIKNVFEDKAVQAQVQKNWATSIERAIKEMGY